ncbi:hypothetical protein LH51_01315 [Nitrincola sp. A-D6]|uniref:glycosyltransferase family 4 protein n=1 Tax=Nitrincola sp. A-D6 TaxID=1545442 RepID=UPI00051FB163|nr:glycosyltransferase family 4 protein [Nitrincola sp. A-D6]KGK43296.1 hypothetical protein LH51_01315 [Nitrincola sp. A-D6]
MAKIVHVLMSEYRVDSRVRNETSSLVEYGFDVDVYCLSGKGLPKTESRDSVIIKRYGLSTKFRSLLFLSACISMLLKSMRSKIDLVHAHDVNALPVAYFLSVIKNIPLIYDSHELWSQAHHKKRNIFILKIVEKLEVNLAKRARAIIAVSDGISNYLKCYFKNVNVYTIRNIPSYTSPGEYDLFRDEFGIEKNRIIFLYQGLMSETRGVNTIIQAACELNNNNDVAFIFMGDGPMSSNILKTILSLKLKNVYYKGAVPQDDLIKYTKSSDVGLHAIKNTCLNHDLCLPNKLFEYIAAGKPVIVSNLTEMSEFVLKNKVGLTFLEGSSDSLVSSIETAVSNKDVIDSMRANVNTINATVNWSNESKILISIYEDLLCES